MSISLERASRAHRILLTLLVALVAAVLAAGCGGDDDKGSDSKSSSKTSSEASGGGDSASGNDKDLDAEVAKREGKYDAPPTEKLDAATKYPVTMETTEGTFTIVVDPKLAPIASANFVFLVKDGFYDGIKFHRVMKEFMIQGGDPTGTGTGGPGYNLKDDPVKGTYKRGVVAMANAGPDTGGSQFFVVQGANVQLPPDYIIFGNVDEAGMKVVDKIADVSVETGANGEPSSPTKTVRIISAKLA